MREGVSGLNDYYVSAVAAFRLWDCRWLVSTFGSDVYDLVLFERYVVAAIYLGNEAADDDNPIESFPIAQKKTDATQ